MISNYDRAIQEAKLARMIWQEAAVKTDRDLMLHCPKHGSHPNNINIVEYNGDRDIFCWCGNRLAIVRGGKMYVQGGEENDN